VAVVKYKSVFLEGRYRSKIVEAKDMRLLYEFNGTEQEADSSFDRIVPDLRAKIMCEILRSINGFIVSLSPLRFCFLFFKELYSSKVRSIDFVVINFNVICVIPI